MARPPHIAYLFSRYPVASQTFCDSEMMALEAAGASLSVVSLNPPISSFRHERLRRLRAEVHYPPPARVLKELPIPPAMRELADDHAARYPRFKIERARNAAWCARLLARLGVDHVHVHFANQATWTALFLRRAGYRFSFTAHAQDFMVDLGNDDLLREMATESEFVVAVSEFSRGLLVERCPDSASKIIRIYNGLDPGEFADAAPVRALDRSPVRIVSIGRLIEFKGFHHLIEAARLLAERGIVAQVEIVGDGPWRSRLETLIAERKVEGAVRLRGPLSHDAIVRELAASDLFVLACCIDAKGASDILPTVILEAMAAGLPVVSTRLAAIPEMVAHGSTGLLVAPDSPEELADAIAGLAGDPEVRRRLGEAGRNQCRDKFSLRHSADQLLSLFHSTVARPPTLSGGVSEPEASPVALVLLDGWQNSRGSNSSDSRDVDACVADRRVFLLAATPGAGSRDWFPERLDYLPDAVVLEAAWRADPVLSARCEELYRVLKPEDGEGFFLQARRAIWTAQLVQRRGISHIHAARSNAILWAWLVRRLTGTRASFAVEDEPLVPRPLLAVLIDDFDFGSISDPRLNDRAGGGFSDVLKLAAAPAPSLFSRRTGDAVDYAAWVARLVDGGPGRREAHPTSPP